MDKNAEFWQEEPYQPRPMFQLTKRDNIFALCAVIFGIFTSVFGIFGIFSRMAAIRKGL